MWVRYRFLDTDTDTDTAINGSNHALISMLCPSAIHIIPIGHVGKMSVSGYSNQRFKPRLHQYAVSFSNTHNTHWSCG